MTPDLAAVAAICILPVLLIVAAMPAAARVCAPAGEVAARLVEIGERPVWHGLSEDGSLVALWQAPSGAWTIVVSAPRGGPECAVSAGRGGEPRTAPAPADRPAAPEREA